MNYYKSFKVIFFSIIFLYLPFKGFIDSSAFFNGEFALIEISQVFLIVFSILLLLYKKKFFYIKYNKLVTELKFIFFLFLLYEEISFITFNSINLFKNINFQSEVNIHNLNLWYHPLLKLPLIGTIGPIPFFICLILLLMGSVRFLNIPKNLYFFALEKKYFPFSFIFFINLFLSKFHNYSDYLLLPELVELLIYLILLFNLLEKLKINSLK